MDASTPEAVAERWKAQLEKPDEGFFPALRARMEGPEGLRDAVREAVKSLVPRVDWQGYLPHVPHGLLGLRAVMRLRPLLSEKDFFRALAGQLHYFAHEGRQRRPAAPAKGSGHWPNLEAGIAKRQPGLAQGEALGIDQPERAQFRAIGRLVAHDMANVGHKAVMAHHLGDLFDLLEQPKATGRRMLGLAAWLAATEPVDTFWQQRARRRLQDAPELRVPEGPAAGDPDPEAVRELCDLGLVDLLDRWTARLRQAPPSGDLLAALAAAAAEKQLDARRDLEGKTSWNFVYLATQALEQAPEGDPAPWCQAAAMVNLFPTDEEEGRVKALPPAGGDPAQGLLDAVLDAEPAQAMGWAGALFEAAGAEAVLKVLAAAAAQNDPAFNHGHQFLMVAAGLDLAPLLPPSVQRAVLEAMAKSLANSQGSGDVGNLAMRAF